MKRRDFLHATALAAGGTMLGAPAHGAAQERPNILWITSEDHGPEMGCYGDDFATTPNVDALAAKGMLFELAWSCAPVCAPARTTLITGMYPPSIGGQHMRSMVTLPDSMRFYPTYLRDQGYYCTNCSKTDYNVQTKDDGWSEQSSNKAHYKNRKSGQPFFAIFNEGASHESRIRGFKGEPTHDPAKVRVPAYHPDTPVTRLDWARYYDTVTMADATAGRRLAELEEAGLTDDTIVFYYGDHGSGMSRSKRWTYNSGLSVPMVVYFPPKWEKLAPKEYKTGGKSDRMVSFVDLAPTLLSLSGVRPPEHMQGHAFAGEFQKEKPKYMFGFRGRMDERYECIRTVTDGRFHYIRNYTPYFIYGQFIAYNFATASTSAWKSEFDAGNLNEAQSHFWGLKPPEELYDLRADPDEVNNLADVPEHQAKQRELRKAQQDWCREIRDLGFLPEGEIHARAEGSTPAEMGRDDAKYPFDRIFQAADMATMRDAKSLPKLKEQMKDADSAVRYWGTIGVLNRGAEAVGVSKKELTAAMSDDSPYVCVAAALALGRHGSPAEQRRAVDRLIELAPWTPDGNLFVSLAALNAIDDLDEKAAYAEEAIKSFPSSGGASPNGRFNGYVGNLLKKMRSDMGVAAGPAPDKRAARRANR